MVRQAARSADGQLDKWLVFGMLGLTLLDSLQGKSGVDVSSSTINQIAWGAAYVVAAGRLFVRNRELRLLLSGSAPMMIFLVLCLLSTIWSVLPGTTFKNSIELAGTAVVGCYIASSLRIVEFLKLLALFFAASSLASLALIFVAPGHGRMFWGSGPWDGIYPEKNALGAAMAIAILVYLINILRPQARYKVLYAGGLLLSMLLLAGSNSATAMLACAAVIALGTFALACVAPGFGGVLRIVAILAAAVVVIAATVVGFNPDMVYELLGRSGTLTGREDFWPYLVDAINARPILGYGYGAFFSSSVSTDYLSYYVVEAGGWSPYHAHDSFLQTLLDTGYVGLTALIVLVLAALMRAVRFLWQQKDVVSLWPLLLIAYLVLGSYTETYLGSFNTLETVLFFSAYLYPMRANFAKLEEMRDWRNPAPAISARGL